MPCKKAAQLGMPFGTASHRLRKSILFHLTKKCGENICFKCNKIIEAANELTIEHKVAWQDNSIDLFWDLENIAFSHARCNRPENFVGGAKKRQPEHIPSGKRWCARHEKVLPIERFFPYPPSPSDGRQNGWQGAYCVECREFLLSRQAERAAKKNRKAFLDSLTP